MIKILFGSFLFLSAWYDLREKRIPVRLFVAFGVIGIAGMICSWGEDGNKSAVWLTFLLALLPGSALLALTAFTKGAIGAGDGCFFLVSACYLSLSKLLFLLFQGLLFCSALSLGMTVWGVASGVNVRKIRLPFLPFLFPAWIWMLFFEKQKGERDESKRR